MVSIEKVEKFFEASGIKEEALKQSNLMLSCVTKNLGGLEDEEDEFIKKEYPDIYNEVITEQNKTFETIKRRTLDEIMNFMKEILSKNLSEEELNELIAFHSRPVSIKMRKITPEILLRMIPFIESIAMEEAEKFEEKLEEITQQVEAS